jgi:hypothetical protein
MDWLKEHPWLWLFASRIMTGYWANKFDLCCNLFVFAELCKCLQQVLPVDGHRCSVCGGGGDSQFWELTLKIRVGRAASPAQIWSVWEDLNIYADCGKEQAVLQVASWSIMQSKQRRLVSPQDERANYRVYKAEMSKEPCCSGAINHLAK